MSPSPQRIVVRAQRIHYPGACSGCFIPVFICAALLIRLLIGLDGRFSMALLGLGAAIVLAFSTTTLWYFFNDIRIARVWNQKLVFDRSAAKGLGEITIGAGNQHFVFTPLR